MAILLRLGAHYWATDFTKAQAQNLLLDYIEDLQFARAADLEIVCREWRQNQANKRFPRSGELLAMLREREKTRQAQNPTPAIDGRIINGEIQPWGGACRCDRCVNKTPSQGFYRAPVRSNQNAI